MGKNTKKTIYEYIHTHTHITELLCYTLGTNAGSDSKELACDVGDPGGEDSLEENMATHSGILAWRIPRTEEPGGLQSTGHKELDTTEWLSTDRS